MPAQGRSPEWQSEQRRELKVKIEGATPSRCIFLKQGEGIVKTDSAGKGVIEGGVGVDVGA